MAPHLPLAPLNSNTGHEEPFLDPFVNLLRSATPSNANSSAKPLFPRTTAKLPTPIDIPKRATGVPKRQSLGPLSSSSSSEFGAFISVSPSEDPLRNAASFSPITASSRYATGPSEFVEEARRRTSESEQRIRWELLKHDLDPMLLVRSGAPDPVQPDRKEEPSPDVDSEVSSWSPGASSTHGSFSRTPLPLMETFSLDEPTAMKQISPSPPPEQEDTFSSSASLPTLSSHPSSSLSASFTQRISSNLPKKLSQFFASSSANPSPPQPRFNDIPPHSSTSSVTSEHLISHKSPFASPIFVPASGAPGFRDDRNWDKGFDFPTTQKVDQPVTLRGRNDTTRPVLPADIVEAIRLHLPPLFRLSQSWTLLYSLDQHGSSIGTFYSRLAKHEGGCLLAIRDANDHRFGVWVGDGIRRSHGESYYGSGESFLWKNQNGLQVFKWTGKNDYVALCEQDYISFGGGDGKYGLFLDSAFCDGSSASCATFDNEALCSNLAGSHSGERSTVRFECIGLEAWGVSR